MKKRLQIILSDGAWSAVETLANSANEGFETGNISIKVPEVEKKVLNSNKADRLLEAAKTRRRQSH